MSPLTFSLTNLSESTMPYGQEQLPELNAHVVGAAWLPVRPIQSLYGTTTPTSNTGSGAPIQCADWWTCHDCGHMNNPDLAPDRCSVCGHYKCCLCHGLVV